MLGGPQQTTQTDTGATSEPWQPAQKALKYGINTGMNLQKKWGHATPYENTAFGQLRDNANAAQGYMPSQQDLINQLYGGGGFGERDQDVRDAMDANRQMLTPYMQKGYLDPMSNPYLQPAIEQARSGAYNQAADQFRAGGRSFSGAMADAASRGMTNAALPLLMGQYNTNVQAQQQAGQQAMQGAVQGGQALDASNQNRLTAQMQAPQQIANLNIPQNMMLQAEAARRNIPLDVLTRTMGLFRAGQLGGQTSGTSTQLQQQAQNPWMQGLGMGMGVLGQFGQMF